MNLFSNDKELAMAELIRQAHDVATETCEPGRKMIWGHGSLDTPLVIVGEAPGDYEEREGRPFVGPAGWLLDSELAGVGISRKSLYVTNVVKCRPIRTVDNRISNRAPKVAEGRAWLPVLIEELEIIDPSIIVCMGGIAAKWLISKDFAITNERGEWQKGPLGIPTLATFHPAYILRLTGSMKDRVLVAFRQDLDKARSHLEEQGEFARIAA